LVAKELKINCSKVNKHTSSVDAEPDLPLVVSDRILALKGPAS